MCNLAQNDKIKKQLLQKEHLEPDHPPNNATLQPEFSNIPRQPKVQHSI